VLIISRSRGAYGRQETCEEGFGGGREGKIPLKESRLRGEDIIKVDVKKVRWEEMHWIPLF